MEDKKDGTDSMDNKDNKANTANSADSVERAGGDVKQDASLDAAAFANIAAGTVETAAHEETAITDGVATSVADDGSFVLMAQLDEDGEMSNELFQELTGALAGLLDETDGNAQLAINYVIGAVEYKIKLAQCQSLDEFEKTMAESIVLPLAKASDSMPDPNIAVSSLMQIDDKSIMEEMGQLAVMGNVPASVNLEDVDFNRIMRYVDDLCRAGIGDENVDAALRDVAHFHEQQRTGNLPELPRQKMGFIKKIRTWRKCIKQQAKMLRNLVKQAHNMRDIEIWYSRYLLSAPIEFAKDEGFWDAALEAGAKSDAAIKKECAEIAQAMGFDYQPWDVDYDRIHRTMRTFCVNKTGYSHVINWIYAASVRTDGKKGSLLS